MRKQPSGGRGEYELVGEQDRIRSIDLTGFGFIWETPFGQKETGIMLSPQGGKRRLRLTDKGIHVQRQAAALALLPRSARGEDRVSHGLPIVLENRYILDIGVELVSRDESMAIVKPAYFTGRSGPAADDAHRVDMLASLRWEDLRSVWGSLSSLPEAIALAVDAHRKALLGHDVIGTGAEKAVATVIDSLIEYGAPGYIPGGDPLPALMVLAGRSGTVELPEPTEAPPEEPEVRLRLEHEYRRQRVRGKSHEDFKKALQKAYDFRCAICGIQALDVPGLARTGVDAAHILPWGKFDMDVVQNGILLCKRDHWAFDSHVLLLRYNPATGYSVEINPRYADKITDLTTKKVLWQATGPIPPSRLPRNKTEWPNPSYIEKLYEGLEEY